MKLLVALTLLSTTLLVQGAGCVDTDNGVEGLWGWTCLYLVPGDCGVGYYDDADFNADAMCCICGGGQTTATEVTCVTDDVCASGRMCVSNICQDPAAAAGDDNDTSTDLCADGIWNQDETSTDCGGVCGECPDETTSTTTTTAEATTSTTTTTSTAVAKVGGDDCYDLDETACVYNADSCRVKSRGGEFRKCQPRRCKQMESQDDCEAAVHCEAKFGRTGSYKKCHSTRHA